MSARVTAPAMGRPLWIVLLEEFLLFLAVGALLVMVLVVIPLGLAAARALDAASALYAGLGAAPLPYRIFVAASAWLTRLAIILAVVVAGHCAFRRTLRRSVSFGDELLWDAIVSPTASAAAAVLVGLVVFAVTAGAPRQSVPFDGAGLAAVFLAVSLGAVGLVLGLAKRSTGFRRLVLAVGVLLALAPLARLAADAWGDARLRSYARSLEPQLAAERLRMASVRSPVLRPPALDEDAAPRYRALMAQISDPIALESLAKAAAGGPGDTPAPGALRLLVENRDIVRGLREAVQCNRCVWELRLMRPNEPMVSLLPARTLARLLVLEGHERARRGDAQGAAERYLDALRFSSDLRESDLISNLVGSGCAELSLGALGRLLVSDLRPPLAQIAAELAMLEGRLPTFATAMRQERLQVLGGLTVAETPDQVFDAPAVLPSLIPYRLLMAQAAEVVDLERRAIERASSLSDPQEAERAIAAVPEPGPAWNPVIRLVSPSASVSSLRLTFTSLTAHLALVKAVLALEQGAAGSHRYPKDAAGLALPKDPLSSGPLRYQASADGSGYRLWSVGWNQLDDGGTARDNLDLVLERPSRR